MVALKQLKRTLKKESLTFFFMLIGLFTIGAAFYYYYYSQLIIHTGLQTTATVISTKEYSTIDDDGFTTHTCKLLIKYDSFQKEIYAPYPSSCQKGFKLLVAYSPKKPHQVKTIDNSHFGLSLIWAIVGGLLIFFSSMAFWLK